MKLLLHQVSRRYQRPFRIASRAQTHIETVVVELIDNDRVGRGEAAGVFYLNETAESLVEQIETLRSEIERGLSREELNQLLPAGGARNALDCALWDLEAKKAGKRVWELAGVQLRERLPTSFTIGIDEPGGMAEVARRAPDMPILKLKLGAPGDADRVKAVRNARPDARLMIDANQGWSVDKLERMLPCLLDARVELIEQPLRAGADEALSALACPIPLCADESCLGPDDLFALQGRYTHVNIKLDKSGGLTSALNLGAAAESLGFRLMAGCMGGSSLAMAPAYILGRYCDLVDLDGPLLLAEDVEHGLRYEEGHVFPPEPALWG